MDRSCMDALKNRIGLLDYLHAYGWKPQRRTAAGQVAGLCPLHADTTPSFWIHTHKKLFYCHACGRGGDLFNLVQWYHGLTFQQALRHLRQHAGGALPLEDAVEFYRAQLSCRPEAMSYLARRGVQAPAIIEAMRIGYAPGGCLRAHLRSLGYPAEQIRQSGLIDPQGRDTLYRRIVFPYGENLYGRSLDDAAPHRFLRAAKDGLYRWEWLQSAADIILVEGFFDVAALWQAGFANVTCGGGARLNRAQFQQLIHGSRTIWIAFDGDAAGQLAAAALAGQLRQAGQPVRRVLLPHSQDPASFFAAGAQAAHFRALLREAQP